MLRTRHLFMMVAVPLAMGAMTILAPGEAAEKPALRLRAFAVDTNVSPARAETLNIVIERWSTDAERDRLRGVLVEKGPDALLDELKKLKPRVGYIATTGRLGWDIHFARQEPSGDGRRIILATDRPMSFWELWNRPRSAEYNFTLAEIRIRADGTGEGKLATAAKVDWNEGTRTIEIENYATQPVRLNEVKVEE